MARHLRPRERVFLGCLVCCTLYLLLAFQNQTLSFSTTWSNSAVRRVQKWEGHRNLSLLVVLPAVCGDLVLNTEDRCLQHISKVCPNFATRSCNVKRGISQSDACDQALLHQKGSNDVKHSLLTPFRRVLPHLKELGWVKQQVLQDNAPNLAASIKRADIVICSTRTFDKHSRIKTHFAVIDDSLMGKLDFVEQDFLQNPQILAVLKPHVVTTPPQRRTQSYRPLAGPYKKPKLAGWDRSKLWQRPVDVVLLSSSADKDSPGYAHHRLAVLELHRLKQRLPAANIITHLADTYDQYLDHELMDAKIVVSVLQPTSEVSLQDYEAWLAGCILIKPRAQDIQAYPNAFQSGYTVFDVHVDFSNVGDVVLGILQHLDKAQMMVDRTTAMLRKHADPAQFAVDLDELLEMSVKESMGLE